MLIARIRVRPCAGKPLGLKPGDSLSGCMPPLPASKGNTEDEVKRSEEFLNQLSLGSTATGTPLTRDTARFEASRSRSGSASRHPEAEVPGDGCHLLEEEEVGAQQGAS
eukprot:s2353_g14.t1